LHGLREYEHYVHNQSNGHEIQVIFGIYSQASHRVPTAPAEP
jgi:hypothetical protein